MTEVSFGCVNGTKPSRYVKPRVKPMPSPTSWRTDQREGRLQFQTRRAHGSSQQISSSQQTSPPTIAAAACPDLVMALMSSDVLGSRAAPIFSLGALAAGAPATVGTPGSAAPAAGAGAELWLARLAGVGIGGNTGGGAGTAGS